MQTLRMTEAGTPSRRPSLRVILGSVVLLAGLLLLGTWLYLNASLPRLRAEFEPWMHRLERYRDALEATRDALRSPEPTPSDPRGTELVRAWARADLARVAGVSFDVDGMPRMERDASGAWRLSGTSTFTVDGFLPDGGRLQRIGAVSVEISDLASARPDAVAIALATRLSNRVEREPRFREATSEAGLGAPRNDPVQPLTNRLIEGIWPGSGVAVLDFDQDGDEDLFAGDGVRSILYENDGRARFTDVTARAGLAERGGVSATGLAAGDVNGDGYPDLLVTDSFGPTRLFLNARDATFEETTATCGVRTEGPTRSAAFADVDADGDLDLFVCGTGDYYGPMPDPPFDANDGRRNYLFVNDGTGRFRDASKDWGLEKPTRWSLSCLFADFDDDGRPDLVVTNDFGLKNLYRNVEGKRFRDVTGKLGVEDRAYGMSGAWGDFDGDGRLDLYTTGTYAQWGFLHRYPGLPVPLPGRIFKSFAIEWMEKMCRGGSMLRQTPEGPFEDVTARSGAGKAGWNWSTVAADLDNDGRLDLYGTNGMWGDGRGHDRELEFWWETLAYWDDYIEMRKTFDRKGAGIQGVERDVYFRNATGRQGLLFTERAFLDGLDLATNGRAVVAFDANGDGALDLYVRSVQAPEALFLGSRKAGEHVLRLRLRGTKGKDNADGVGARVTATLPDGRVLVRENASASGFLATGSPIVHLGLGAAARVERLVVRWPSGFVQEMGGIEAVDRLLVVDQTAGAPSGPPAAGTPLPTRGVP